VTSMQPSMRLKVKDDTFYLPDSNGSVYFRNNAVSFRMEGEMIDRWIEMLLPVFNGEHTLGELTDGLPHEHRNRVYEIAESLYRNGFVRDVSRDRPHSLPEEILEQYASQIAFLNHFGDSGAYRFQCYRQAKVLAAGSGPFLVSLVSALLESGLPRFRVLLTDARPTSTERLRELEAHARRADTEVKVDIVSWNESGNGWREIIAPFDYILHVSQDDDAAELRALHAACKELGKKLLPAICIQQAGVAGPLVQPGSGWCWESAWLRIHRTAVRKDALQHTFSSTAGAMLANVLAFELFKEVTAVIEPEMSRRLFVLDLETLEAYWHPFEPHPLVAGKAESVTATEVDLKDGAWGTENRAERSNGLFALFSRITSEVTGIFHLWEEGDLKQLPLSMCRVQVADPLSEGPAELLPDVVCAGFTHEEARREAGLCGIETYAARLAERIAAMPGRGEGRGASVARASGSAAFVGVGAGETAAEAVCRGLSKCLADELGKRYSKRPPSARRVTLSEAEDERCRFYMRALATMCGDPVIGLGEELYGFPVVWVGAGERWYGCADVNRTSALREALRLALARAQHEKERFAAQAIEVSSVLLFDGEPENISIFAEEARETEHAERLRSALRLLERNGRRLKVFDLAVEPFLKEELAGVYGVCMREAECR